MGVAADPICGAVRCRPSCWWPRRCARRWARAPGSRSQSRAAPGPSAAAASARTACSTPRQGTAASQPTNHVSRPASQLAASCCTTFAGEGGSGGSGDGMCVGACAKEARRCVCEGVAADVFVGAWSAPVYVERVAPASRDARDGVQRRRVLHRQADGAALHAQQQPGRCAGSQAKQRGNLQPRKPARPYTTALARQRLQAHPERGRTGQTEQGIRGARRGREGGAKECRWVGVRAWAVTQLPARWRHVMALT